MILENRNVKDRLRQDVRSALAGKGAAGSIILVEQSESGDASYREFSTIRRRPCALVSPNHFPSPPVSQVVSESQSASDLNKSDDVGQYGISGHFSCTSTITFDRNQLLDNVTDDKIYKDTQYPKTISIRLPRKTTPRSTNVLIALEGAAFLREIKSELLSKRLYRDLNNKEQVVWVSHLPQDVGTWSQPISVLGTPLREAELTATVSIGSQVETREASSESSDWVNQEIENLLLEHYPQATDVVTALGGEEKRAYLLERVSDMRTGRL